MKGEVSAARNSRSSIGDACWNANAVWVILNHMVKDRMRNISRYSALSEGIRDITDKDSSPLPDFHGYRVDRTHTIVFSLTRGSAVFATSWRENPDSRESNAVMKASAGEFVLFLPGEPYIMRSEEQSLEVSMYVLD